MAPLPEHNTARVYWDYSDGINEHTLTVRYAPSAGIDVASDHIHNFLDALSPQLFLLTHRGFRASASGTNVSLPATWNGNLSYGAGAMPGNLAPRQLCFLARSPTGRRVRWFLWGGKYEPNSTFRFPSGYSPDLDAARAAITAGQVAGVFLAIDGNDPTLYPYVDVNYNSYYEEKARG